MSLTIDQRENEKIAPPRMTFEEFLVWRETDETAWAEWEDGQVLYLPSSAPHQFIVGFLLALFQHWIEARISGGTVLVAPFLMRARMGGSGREPDLLYIAPENRNRLRHTLLDGPADLVVEVVSPESRGRDRNIKYFEYEQAGVREYWVLDPETREAEFYRLDETGTFRRIALSDAGVYESEVLNGFRLDTNWLWQNPLPPLMSILRGWGMV